MTVLGTPHNYQALRDEAEAIGARALELAELAASSDPISSHNLRIIAALGRKIVVATERRIQDLASGKGQGNG